MIPQPGYIFSISIQKMSHYSPQILRTLSHQVQNLTPLRESFRRLEKYYLQLTQDFNLLLVESDASEDQLLTNLKYLQEIHHSLQRESGGCSDDIRELECEHARMQMEKNQQIAQAEALKGRQQLQMEENNNLQHKRKELAEHNQKLTFTIAKYKEMIHNIELTVKSKEYQNLDIQREIKKMELVNQKIAQLNRDAERNIDDVQKQNEEAVEHIYEFESKQGTYDKLIEAKERQNKESLQTVIAKTEDWEQVKHRKEYIEKLIDNEKEDQKDLTKTTGQLESILSAKKDKLMFVAQENNQYQNMIEEERRKQEQNKDEYSKLKLYLQTLVSTNQDLFHELEKSCSQDREVQVMLSAKLERLMVINDEVAENDILNKYNTSYIPNPRLPRERELVFKKSPPKELTNFNSSLLNKSSSPKGSLIDKLSLTKTQQMGSTWGTRSRSKQNRYTDL